MASIDHAVLGMNPESAWITSCGWISSVANPPENTFNSAFSNKDTQISPSLILEACAMCLRVGGAFASSSTDPESEPASSYADPKHNILLSTSTLRFAPLINSLTRVSLFGWKTASVSF